MVMKSISSRSAVLIAVLQIIFNTSLIFSQNKLPDVVILATGGTIAGSAATGAQAGYTSGQVTIDAMINSVPELKKIANISCEQISNVGSQDMTFDIMMKLAKRIAELAATGKAEGIVITHGTDVLEETAYFLNLVVKADLPIVMVGSMRPSTAISADGPLNLYNAVAVAADSKVRGYGVLVVMNDNIHSAQNLIKMNTTSVQTFMSPDKGAIGRTNYGVMSFTASRLQSMAACLNSQLMACRHSPGLILFTAALICRRI